MLYAGIDIGGMNIKMGIVDQSGKVLINNSIKTESDKGSIVVIDQMVSNLKFLCDKIKVKLTDLEGIGCGVPGVADSKKGIVTAAANIGWYNVELAKLMTERTGLLTKIANDANCAASGEQIFGEAKRYNNFVFITLGTGIGSGIIIDGKMVEGEGSAGAECGHMTLVYDGIQCNCGRKGCWEKYASATALIHQTDDAIKKHPNSGLAQLYKKQGKISGRTAFEAMENGDEVAKRVVEQYVNYVASGIISLSCILHPQAFIIGGGISHEGEALMKPLKQKVDKYVEVSNNYPYVAVERATLGNGAGLLGAASLLMRNND